MNERPTPETDAFSNRSFEHRSDELEKLYDHAIRLERERDEWYYKAHANAAFTLEARAERDEARRERDEALEALDRIARPVWWMQEDQKRKTGSINGICGGMALALSEDAEYLKGIAKSALNRGTK